MLRLLSRGYSCRMSWEQRREAAKGGNLIRLKDLMGRLSVHDCQCGAFGATLLHYAASNVVDCADCIEWLAIVCKLDIDARTSRCGATPLHFAVVNGNPKCVRVLLRLGAKVDATNNRQRTPLALAFARNSRLCGCLLIDCGASVTITIRKHVAPPHWALAFCTAQQWCHRAVVLLLAIRGFKRSVFLAALPRDIVMIVARDLWAMRFCFIAHTWE
jgi:hypothetical protein